jgi:hypothetical protein
MTAIGKASDLIIKYVPQLFVGRLIDNLEAAGNAPLLAQELRRLWVPPPPPKAVASPIVTKDR